MNFAVVKFSGKQYIVQPGFKIQVNNLTKEVGDAVNFDNVLLVVNGGVKVGKPLVKNFKVVGKIVRKFAGPKITVVKFRPKSRYLRKIGARQKLAEIEIKKIQSSSKT